MTDAELASHHALNDREARGLAASSNAFAVDLWRQVRSVPGNLAVSPASISMAMAMTYGGARGETAAQIRSALHFVAEPSAQMGSWGLFARTLADGGSRSLKLSIANRLFGEATYAFEADYVEATAATFGAPLERLSFKTAPDSSRLHINAWVEEQTSRRIQALLPPAAIHAQTRLVLVNAIDFVAAWESAFEVSKTVRAPFHTPTATKHVPTMCQTTYMRFLKADGAKVLELTYENEEAALMIVLPDAADGLDGLEETLSLPRLESWMDRMTMEYVDIHLPRFEVTTAAPIPLAGELNRLGMPLAFDEERADFTAIGNPANPIERLAISEVFHKAVVKTDEQGTVASAATGVTMAVRGRPPPAVAFKADHPFLFFIVERKSRLVLFMGRVVDP